MTGLFNWRGWRPASHLGYVWLIVAIVTIGTILGAARWKRSDVFVVDSGGYYLYLSSKFITNDIGDASYVNQIRASYRPDLDANYGVMTLPNGKKVFHYPIGMAFAYAPWFGLAHAFSLVHGNPADGYSMPYQALVAVGCMLYALWGLWLLGQELRRYFPDHLAALTILGIGLGTNLLCYATYEATMSHATLFFLNVLLLRNTRAWYERGGWPQALGLAVGFGFMMLIRPSEVMMMAVPVLWGVTSLAAGRQRLAFWLSRWAQVLAMVLMVGAIGSIQLLFWRVVGGSWLIDFYPGQTFHFADPHLMDGLFSVRKGWLFWTPLMALALLGIIWTRRFVAAAWPVLVVLVPVFVYVTFCWWDWAYGGGFSARPLISLYPLLSFALASFFARWWPALAVPLAVLVLLLILLNIMQGWQYFLGMVNCCVENWENYRKYFFDLQWPNP